MSSHLSEQHSEQHSQPNKTYITGSILILIGILFFVDQIVQSPLLASLFLPGLGLIFIAWSLILRNFGLLIPGGILTGIGFGLLLMDASTLLPARLDDAAVFMIVFGLGWGLITLLSPLTEHDLTWWPLIPGGIITGIGLIMLTGEWGEWALNLFSYIWPIFLIGAGSLVIIRRYRGRVQ